MRRSEQSKGFYATDTSAQDKSKRLAAEEPAASPLEDRRYFG
jgi:hypothetical protein